jgi:hypothetical protein
MAKIRLLPLFLFVYAASMMLSTGVNAQSNTLTAKEVKEGWRLLWDGKTMNGWRSFGKEAPPSEGWVIEKGTLKKVANVRGGDIITLEKFTDFDLTWEWKLPARANNGLKYFIIEDRGPIGHEYQMIDDSTVKNTLDSTASFYLVVAPSPKKPLKPTGQWNSSRVLVQGNHVEHWLNGMKVLEYECGAPAILAQVAKTKFKNVPNFGKKITGHILLTDHVDECSYRNIKIRKMR